VANVVERPLGVVEVRLVPQPIAVDSPELGDARADVHASRRRDPAIEPHRVEFAALEQGAASDAATPESADLAAWCRTGGEGEPDLPAPRHLGHRHAGPD